MNKVIRDGKVAILYSPGYGAGWSSWASISINPEVLMFDPNIVDMVERKQNNIITEDQFLTEVDAYCVATYGEHSVYTGGATDIIIEWVPEGTLFKINEYDGYETIQFKESDQWVTA